MWKSVKAKVDDLLATEFHQLHKQKIHKIHAAMEALVYGAEKVSTIKRKQFQVHPNRARQVATTWSDTYHQKAIERFERKMHQVTPDEGKLFDKLFQHHEWQLLLEVGTKATSPRSIFAQGLALRIAATEDEAYGAANMTADKWLQFQVHLSDAEIEAMTWILADTECVTTQLQRGIEGITWNEPMRFKKEFSICLIDFEALWEEISIHALRKTNEQHVIHLGYPKMHVVGNMSESIRWMRSGDNFITDISE